MFKSFSKSLLAAVALAATLPAAATTFSFMAGLSGANEVPANASTATGTTLVTFDDVLNNVTVNVIFSGLAAAASAAHIHCCSPPGVNSGVQIGLAGFPASTSNTYNGVLTPGVATFALVLAGAQAGQAYVNLHNPTFPGGELRGNLVPVPEVST